MAKRRIDKAARRKHGTVAQIVGRVAVPICEAVLAHQRGEYARAALTADRSRRLGRDGAHEHAPGPDDEAPVCVCHLPQAPNRARDGKPRLTKSALARREHGLGTD